MCNTPTAGAKGRVSMHFEMVKKKLFDAGIAELGFSDLRGVLPERYRRLPYGITLVYRLSNAVVDEILTYGEPGPTYSYFQHYRAVNAALDQEALWLSTLIEREGYLALPIPASQSVKDMGHYSGAFQHKTAAVKAGLGWIGKSALFVSPKFGPRVRLATILTDMPLPVEGDTPAPPGCKGCRICVDACPARAIKGENYTPGAGRDVIFDPKACSEHMKKTYIHIGRGAVCGICMAACPFGKKN